MIMFLKQLNNEVLYENEINNYSKRKKSSINKL